MNTCSSCFYWQWPYADDGRKHLCCNPKVGSKRQIPPDGADIENGENATGIITGAGFGCIHWENKPIDMPEISYTKNTARVFINGDKRMVRLELETSIKDRKQLEILLSRTLKAASLAEKDTSFMTEEETNKAYCILNNQQTI